MASIFLGCFLYNLLSFLPASEVNLHVLFRPLFILAYICGRIHATIDLNLLLKPAGLHYLLTFSFDSLLSWFIYFPFRIRWPHALCLDHTTTRGSGHIVLNAHASFLRVIFLAKDD
ncbi:hypothetical protein CsSME_00011981 [Camellia sinensis var. sinensis]